MDSPVTAGPSLRRRQLGEALTRLREHARKTGGEAAHELGCTEGKIRHIEAGRNVVSKSDLRVLLEFYRAADRFPELEELRLACNQRGWWETHGLPKWMATLIGLETDAEVIRCFALELVPGLLQNYDYATQAYLRQGTPTDEAPQLASARMERQRRLGTEQKLEVVMSEAVLHRTLGMGDYGRAQLATLVNFGGMQAGLIQVLPFSAGGHRSMSGSFTLLEFPAGTVDPVAYQEYALGGHLADDPKLVGKLTQLFAALQIQALDQQGSLDLVQQLLDRSEEGK